jgi:hypothetical protein
MKTLALAVVAAIGLGAATSAQAGVWFNGPSGFDAPSYGGPHGGGPYFVAGFGDDNHLGQPRYWGGPYWTMCRGTHPPFQTYRIPPASCRPWAVKMAARQHHPRIVRARLK